MSRRPSFRRDPPPGSGALRVVAAVALLALVLLAMRASLPQEGLEGAPVQVVGEVPHPGWYELPDPTVHEALRAAGADPGEWPDGPVSPGWRVVVRGGELVLEPSGSELVFGLPLDLNRADAESLEALPGIGPALARAIVEDREQRGHFSDVEALQRVSGIGPDRLEALRPFVAVEVPPP